MNWKDSIYGGFGPERKEESRIVARTVLSKGFLWEWADPSIPHKITYEGKVCGDFWPRHMACGMLFPRPGIEPMPLQWKCRVLATGLLRKSLDFKIM